MEEEQENVRVRQPIQPETLQGVYTPVYFGDALMHFVNAQPENFGPIDPVNALATQQPRTALMDSLPLIRQGYSLRNSITMLFYIYVYVNQLQNPQNAQLTRSDQVMRAAFDGQIPASFYSYRDENGRSTKITMNQAVTQGLISGPMNTYDVIRQTYPDFRSASFNTYYFQNIASLNYYSRANLLADPVLQPAAAFFDDPNIQAAMVREHQTIKDVIARWQEVLEPQRRAAREARRARFGPQRTQVPFELIAQLEQVQMPIGIQVPISPPRINVPTIPQVPMSPSRINVPQMSPLRTNIPQVPTIPPMQMSPSRVNVPQVPTIPQMQMSPPRTNVPQVPTIPQMQMSPPRTNIPTIPQMSPPRTNIATIPQMSPPRTNIPTIPQVPTVARITIPMPTQYQQY